MLHHLPAADLRHITIVLLQTIIDQTNQSTVRSDGGSIDELVAPLVGRCEHEAPFGHLLILEMQGPAATFCSEAKGKGGQIEKDLAQSGHIPDLDAVHNRWYSFELDKCRLVKRVFAINSTPESYLT